MTKTDGVNKMDWGSLLKTQPTSAEPAIPTTEVTHESDIEQGRQDPETKPVSSKDEYVSSQKPQTDDETITVGDYLKERFTETAGKTGRVIHGVVEVVPLVLPLEMLLIWGKNKVQAIGESLKLPIRRHADDAEKAEVWDKTNDLHRQALEETGTEISELPLRVAAVTSGKVVAEGASQVVDATVEGVKKVGEAVDESVTHARKETGGWLSRLGEWIAGD